MRFEELWTDYYDTIYPEGLDNDLHEEEVKQTFYAGAYAVLVCHKTGLELAGFIHEVEEYHRRRIEDLKGRRG